jgi:hypothetical protein
MPFLGSGPAGHRLRSRPVADRRPGRLTIAASDVCMEVPSVIALVEAGRGATIIPRLALTDAAITICPSPAAVISRPSGEPARATPPPATAAVLRTLAGTGEQLTSAR